MGKRILDEALRRRHSVTGIARESSNATTREHYKLVSGDADRPEALSPLLEGHDAVISSVPFRSTHPAKLIDAVRRSGVKRYLVVGGAGSLEATPGTLVLEMPHFAEMPEWVKLEAMLGKLFIDALRRVNDLDWTMLSPSAIFTEGGRTGKFRLGKNALLTGADGKSQTPPAERVA